MSSTASAAPGSATHLIAPSPTTAARTPADEARVAWHREMEKAQAAAWFKAREANEAELLTDPAIAPPVVRRADRAAPTTDGTAADRRLGSSRGDARSPPLSKHRGTPAIATRSPSVLAPSRPARGAPCASEVADFSMRTQPEPAHEPSGLRSPFEVVQFERDAALPRAMPARPIAPPAMVRSTSSAVGLAEEMPSQVPAAADMRFTPTGSPRDPVRVHWEAAADGAVTVWLGIDAIALPELSPLARFIRQGFVASGHGMPRMLCNGKPLLEPAGVSIAGEPAQPPVEPGGPSHPAPQGGGPPKPTPGKPS